MLCAHIPPAVDDLTFDVVAQRAEPGSVTLLEHIRAHEPAYLYFGHVHHPRCERMKIGRTVAVNVGSYFRSTGGAVDHPA